MTQGFLFAGRVQEAYSVFKKGVGAPLSIWRDYLQRPVIQAKVWANQNAKQFQQQEEQQEEQQEQQKALATPSHAWWYECIPGGCGLESSREYIINLTSHFSLFIVRSTCTCR